jgi:phytol kinase
MTPLNLNPWIAIPAILAGMVVLFAVLRAWQVLAHPHPELVRKLFHLGGGLLALPLPWLFSSPVPVLVLGASSIVLFTLLRTVPVLRAGPGQVLAAVQRNTVGEYGFILSLLLLFVWAHDNPLLYGVPLLILAIADASAALIGKQYGKVFYSVSGGDKSVEGSLAFFLAAFFCVHVPVLLFTDTPRAETLLIGINIGLMVMMAEAAAWWGLDNLIIPLFSYVLLRTFLHLDAAELLQHLGFLVALSLFIRYWRRHTTLADDGLFGVALWGYVAWAIGDWHWVVPPLILLIVYTAVTSRTPTDHLRLFNFPVALANLFGSIVWLLLFWRYQDGRIFAAYAAVYGADLSIIALVRHRRAQPGSSMRESVAWSSFKGILLLIPSILLFQGLGAAALLSLAGAALAVIAATIVFAAIQPGLERFPVDNGRWLRQSVVAALCSLLAFTPALFPASI